MRNKVKTNWLINEIKTNFENKHKISLSLFDKCIITRKLINISLKPVTLEFAVNVDKTYPDFDKLQSPFSLFMNYPKQDYILYYLNYQVKPKYTNDLFYLRKILESYEDYARNGYIDLFDNKNIEILSAVINYKRDSSLTDSLEIFYNINKDNECYTMMDYFEIIDNKMLEYVEANLYRNAVEKATVYRNTYWGDKKPVKFQKIFIGEKERIVNENLAYKVDVKNGIYYDKSMYGFQLNNTAYSLFSPIDNITEDSIKELDNIFNPKITKVE